MSLRLIVVVAACLLGAGCGREWEVSYAGGVSNDNHTREHERIREDLERLEEDRPLKYHDSEKELRRHQFEREFYDEFHGYDRPQW